MTAAADWLTLTSTETPPSVWPPPPRAPLPPNPKATGTQPPDPEAECWSDKGDYKTALSSPFPKVRNRRIVRGSFCGISVPGYVSGDNPGDPSFFMTWQATGCSDSQARLAIDCYFDEWGWDSILLSRPQAINQVLARLAKERGIDDPDGLGWWLSEQDSRDVEAEALANTIRVALYCQSKGMFVHLVAVSDGYKFQTAVSWLDAMIAAGALIPGKDTICAAWQIDKWYDPMGVCNVLNDGAPYANQHDFLFGPHWGGGYKGWAENCACWDADTETTFGVKDRWTFQRWFSTICKAAVHYGQCDINAPIDAVQSWIYKIIIAFIPGMIFIAAEMSSQGRYWWPFKWPVSFQNLKTRLAMASPNPVEIELGYFDGGQDYDGSVL